MESFRILVCFKIANELESVIAQDWESARDANFDIDYTRPEIGCFEEGALETALTIRDAENDNGAAIPVLTTLTIGCPSVLPNVAKRLFACGFDAVHAIRTDEDLRFQPERTAACIAAYILQYGPFDAILMGCQANPGNHGKVPLAVAAMLELPYVGQVRDLVRQAEGFQVVAADPLPYEQLIFGPAVYAFCNAKHTYLRVPTLREKLAVSDKAPEYMPEETFAGFASAWSGRRENRVTSLRHPVLKRANVSISGATPDEKAVKLLTELRQHGFLAKGSV